MIDSSVNKEEIDDDNGGNDDDDNDDNDYYCNGTIDGTITLLTCIYYFI